MPAYFRYAYQQSRTLLWAIHTGQARIAHCLNRDHHAKEHGLSPSFTPDASFAQAGIEPETNTGLVCSSTNSPTRFGLSTVRGGWLFSPKEVNHLRQAFSLISSILPLSLLYIHFYLFIYWFIIYLNQWKIPKGQGYAPRVKPAAPIHLVYRKLCTLSVTPSHHLQKKDG